MADSMQELMVRIAARIDDLQAKLEQAQSGITKISDHTKSKSKDMKTDWLEVTKAIAIWEFGVQKAKDMMVAMVNEAIKMQTTMNDIQLITGASGEEMADYGEIARTTGMKLGFLGTETAEAMKAMMVEGIKSGTAVRTVLVPALELARTTGLSTTQATNMITDTLKAFSLSLKDSSMVADIYYNTLKKTSLTQDSLNQMITNAAPTARAYGVSIQNLTALFQAFDGIGVNSQRGSMAYRMAMQNLTKAFDDNGKAVSAGGKVLEAHGITAQRLASLMKDPVEMLRVFGDTNMSAADAQKVFGERAGQVMFNMMASKKVLDEAKASMEGLQSTTDAANKTMMTWAGTMALFKAEIMGMGSVVTERVLPAITKFMGVFAQLNEWMKKNTAESVSMGTMMFGSIGGTIEKITSKWLNLANTHKATSDQISADTKKMEEPCKDVQTAASELDQIFLSNAEAEKIAREKMVEIEQQFHQKLFEMSEKTNADRRENINREIESWRQKGIAQDELDKLRVIMQKKYAKEVTDDAYKKIKESDGYNKASNLERMAMLKSWRENSINNNEAIKVSAQDLAEAEKAAAADTMETYQNVFMKPMDEGFKELFKGIKEGNMDIGKAAETVAKASGKAILEALAKQADANVATTITAAAAQGGVWGLAANSGAIALAVAQALAVHAILASFAEGGIVSGPGVAMVGDRPEGPEVIAGLDQLQDMLRPRHTDTGSQNAGEPGNNLGGGSTNVTLNYNHNPNFSFASPAEARRSGMEIIRVLQEFGFTPARA